MLALSHAQKMITHDHLNVIHLHWTNRPRDLRNFKFRVNMKICISSRHIFCVPEGTLVPTTITVQLTASLPSDLPQLLVHPAEKRR